MLCTQTVGQVFDGLEGRGGGGEEEGGEEGMERREGIEGRE